MTYTCNYDFLLGFYFFSFVAEMGFHTQQRTLLKGKKTSYFLHVLKIKVWRAFLLQS